MLPNYFEILGIPQDASEYEIKQAYRKKAKEFHPSNNKSPDALDKFILINEAYEILIHRNTHEIYLQDFNTAHDPLKHEPYYYWINVARTRAAQHAGLTLNEFLNTPFYRDTYMHSRPTLIIFMIIGLILLVAPFASILLAQDRIGVLGILAVIFVAWPAGLYFFVQSASGFQSMKKYMR